MTTNNDSEAMVEMRRVTLDKLKFACQEAIGRTTLDSMNIDSYMDFVSKSVIMRVKGYVLSDEIAKDSYGVTSVFSFPSSWWQHLKWAKAPQWFLKRYPVKYTDHHQQHTVEISRKATYPMANIAIQDNPAILESLGGKEVIKDVVSIKNE